MTNIPVCPMCQTEAEIGEQSDHTWYARCANPECIVMLGVPSHMIALKLWYHMVELVNDYQEQPVKCPWCNLPPYIFESIDTIYEGGDGKRFFQAVCENKFCSATGPRRKTKYDAITDWNRLVRRGES